MMPAAPTAPEQWPLEEIRRRLAQAPSRLEPFAPVRTRAAVALMLGRPEAQPPHAGAWHLAFILRADRPGDPWSGHMAFPGGRADPGDASIEAVARREVSEELGMDLTQADYLAPLDDQPVAIVTPPMVLSAQVYAFTGALPAWVPNGEVSEAMWIPLGQLWDPAHATHKSVAWAGQVRTFPAIRHQHHLIWGLTWRVLEDFSLRLGQTLPLAPEAHWP